MAPPPVCDGIASWRSVLGTTVSGGKQVERDGYVFRCRSWPNSLWCGDLGYDPLGNNGSAAWVPAGVCVDRPVFCASPQVTAWAAWASYLPGDLVRNANGDIHRCRPWPNSPWCALPGYQTGISAASNDAWALVDHCGTTSGPIAFAPPPADRDVPDAELDPSDTQNWDQFDIANDPLHLYPAYGAYDRHSVMHYEKWAYSNDCWLFGLKCKTTIVGAPSNDRGSRLTSGDVIGVIFANYPSSLWLNDTADFFGTLEEIGPELCGFWHNFRWANGGLGDLYGKIDGAMIPPDDRVLFLNTEWGSAGGVEATYGRKSIPWLLGPVQRVVMQPTVSIFEYEGFNGKNSQVGRGRTSLGAWLGSTTSVAVGPGLWGRMCPNTSDLDDCLEVSSGWYRFVELPEDREISTLEVRPALTLYSERSFGQAREYQKYDDSGQFSMRSLPVFSTTPVAYPDLDRLDDRASSVYVAPGLLAELCANHQGPECTTYGLGPHADLGTLNDRVSLVNIRAGATFFEAGFTDLAERHLTVVSGGSVKAADGEIRAVAGDPLARGVVSSDAISSNVLAPGASVQVCNSIHPINGSVGNCTTIDGGSDGRVINYLDDVANDKIKFIRVF